MPLGLPPPPPVPMPPLREEIDLALNAEIDRRVDEEMAAPYWQHAIAEATRCRQEARNKLIDSEVDLSLPGLRENRVPGGDGGIVNCRSRMEKMSDDPTRQTKKSAPLDWCRSERTSGRLCRTWMAPSAQQRYLWNRDLPLRANRELFWSTVSLPVASSALGGGRPVRHSARRRVVLAATGSGVFVRSRCLLRNGACPDRASGVGEPVVNRDQPGSKSTEMRHSAAPSTAAHQHRRSPDSALRRAPHSASIRAWATGSNLRVARRSNSSRRRLWGNEPSLSRATASVSSLLRMSLSGSSAGGGRACVILSADPAKVLK